MTEGNRKITEEEFELEPTESQKDEFEENLKNPPALNVNNLS